jgi:hypothetical protein
MSQPPLPESRLTGWLAWVPAALATFLLLGSIALVIVLWSVDSADPPPGSLLDPPVTVSTTPQYATTPK